MAEAEYEDSFREMIENRLYLDNVEREAFGKVVKQGVPSTLRGKFWNLCTGIHMYQTTYCKGYYQTLQDSIATGDL